MNTPPQLAERLATVTASLLRLVQVMERCPPEDDWAPHYVEWIRALDEARMVLRREGVR